jgi:hypothetical protein
MSSSKSQVNKAGIALANADDPMEATLSRYSEVIDEWRALHGDPLYWMADSVRGRLSRVLRHVGVGQRLKRMPQIIAKLQRKPIKLARMQDLGGGRGGCPVARRT